MPADGFDRLRAQMTRGGPAFNPRVGRRPGYSSEVRVRPATEVELERCRRKLGWRFPWDEA